MPVFLIISNFHICSLQNYFFLAYYFDFEDKLSYKIVANFWLIF